MKHISLAALLVLAGAGVCMAQTDVLGAHRNAGHGCSACHTVHSQPDGWGAARRPSVQDEMLWGNEAPLVPADVAPARSVSAPERAGMLKCLTCHDGNYAPPAMMRDRVYEAVPDIYGGSQSVPTLADRPAVSTGVDLEQHPVGESARLDCGSGPRWDCMLGPDGLSMTGKRSARFAMTYGYFIKPRRSGESAVVVCTTCHNPHSMTSVSVSADSASSLYPAGTYASRYFLRAPYASGASTMGNQSSQFCRQCHADKSNEMNGSRAGSSL